ncbi:hypothetical protein [Ornithinibacillus sp. 179-J 7C1 HS]|uniref:YphA family membrane protein n=1 Tax=Ornithinibacillus sp. 179-J 7C1 HS TaxID=3142384 RepID=UPI0039A18C85
MDGIFYYWFSWILWVILTFFMPKNKNRTIYSVWILITIIFSNVYITSDYLEISIAYLSIIIGGFILLSTLKRKGILLFSAFTIMIGYASLLIWETNAPVWIFMPRLLIIPIICVLLTVILTKRFISRITISLIGLCSGEFLYSLLLTNYSITKTIGGLMFLDTLFVVLFIIVIITAVQLGKERVSLFLFNKMNNI